MRPRAAAAAGIALLGLAGCGSGPDAPPLGSALHLPAVLDACRLLTDEEADAAAGRGLNRLTRPIDHAIDSVVATCTYGTDPDHFPVQLVRLEVRRLPSVEKARAVYDSSISQLRSLARGDTHELQGIGESALWAGGVVNQLHALRGQVHLIVTLELGDAARRSTVAREIAERAIRRLESSAK